MNDYDTTSFPWTSVKSFFHTHRVNISYVLRQHHSVVQINHQQSIRTTHHTITFAHSGLFYPATCFGQSFWPSSGRDKMQVQKENFYRSLLYLYFSLPDDGKNDCSKHVEGQNKNECIKVIVWCVVWIDCWWVLTFPGEKNEFSYHNNRTKRLTDIQLPQSVL